ncbi:MAG: sugar O-acetyltransferase [Acholeplasmatales bacterium]|jgi:maltose O-acetyltransferase|nr:sugar O-acetyltransferase [Acholeplasmataceae bacterium]MDY0115347.1 sugar O-acetyltransferase [Acholeplasmatales bacterium]MCK9234046.1 sugar O-acetyltransferase [Acholeplasmataceae bacterium]MCK9289771.1 sugar O-acetyltransferase [Acholeplasmataceae bacterium]MCK9428058.1 sugar O-acetyltransferase [Acholeplasmataceae bacterium]
MTEKEKMLKEKLYMANDQELRDLNNKARTMMDEFNNTRHSDFQKRREIANKLFGRIGINANINKSLYVDYGFNIEIGDNFYSNFNLTIIDVSKVIIGNNVLLGPNVSLYTAGHPIDPLIRTSNLEYGKKIIIGDNVWLGGNVIVNPGVKIGDNSVIGSGSVVTKEIPSNVVAAGNPCRVIRKINNDDKIYWNKLKDEYYKK